MRRLVPFLLILALIAVLCSGCGESVPSASVFTDDMITEMVLEQFAELAKIPRPSHHEERISDYMLAWAQERGFEAARDSSNNVVIDVPATAGMESRPLVILQGHMDMVFVTGLNSGLDPLTTVIRTVNDGVFLSSDGNTSLGADDGIGDAIAMCIAEGKMAHGPLRLLFTTNEEDGTTGTMNLDPKTVQDADYLINIDSEDEGVVTVSSASGTAVHMIRNCGTATSEKSLTLLLTLSGLRGGHSGLDIGKGRLNASVGLGRLLQSLSEAEVEYEICSFESGTAKNAIPDYAEAAICLEPADAARAGEFLADMAEQLRAEYAEADPDLTLEITQTDTSGDVLPREEGENLIRLLTGLINGVNTMSAEVEGLVESSSNIGLVHAGNGTLEAWTFVRSSVSEREEEILAQQTGLCGELGFSSEVQVFACAWPYKPDNRLLDLTKTAYRELFGREIEVVADHAGLECGSFAGYNPDIDIISIGPTLQNPHSVNERLELASIPMIWHLLEKILSAV